MYYPEHVCTVLFGACVVLCGAFVYHVVACVHFVDGAGVYCVEHPYCAVNER